MFIRTRINIMSFMCTLYIYPAVGVGDPHYLTFDRPSTYYHFQGRGTYSTLDVLNEEGNIVFALQGRQDIGDCPPRGVTWHTGIAFGEPNILSYQVCYRQYSVT